MPLDEETADHVRQKEFYLAKAKEHPLLEQVVAGKTSFTECLDDIFTRISEGGEKWTAFKGSLPIIDFEPRTELLEEFSECLGTIVELSEAWDECPPEYAEALKEYWDGAAGYTNRRLVRGFNIVNFGMTGALGALLLLLVPGGALVELAAFLGSSGAVGTSVGLARRSRKKTAQKREACTKTLAPVYEAAGHLDSEIAAVFAVEHFREAPEHFGRMYPLLSDGQRQYVDGQLLDFLGAGGMPGMDEQQLKWYLGGLLAGLTPGS